MAQVDKSFICCIEIYFKISWFCFTQRSSQGHKAWNQQQPFRGQTLSGMLEAKTKDQGHKRKCSPKRKKGLKKVFQAI